MSNIATGIGLSGKLESDTSGQDSRVEAAKFGAMTRLAKKKEEEEAKKSIEKEVRRNIVVDHKLDNEFYQDQFSDRATKEISEVIGGYSRGEMTEAEVWKRVQGFKDFSGKIHSADKELTATKAKIEKDPFNYDWMDAKTFGGKEVNSFFEAVNNNPQARTEEGFNELQNLYPGAEYSFIRSTPEEVERGAPDFVVKYNPMQMINPKDIVSEIAKDSKRFTVPFIGEAMPVKDEKGFDKWIAPVGTKMNEAVLEEAVNNALEDPQMVFGLQRYYEAQLRREYKKNNPDKSERDFMDSDWQNEIPKLLDRDLVNPLREMVANQGYREVTKTAPKSTAPKESDFRKTVTPSEMSVSSYSLMDKDNNEAGDITVNEVKYTERPNKKVSTETLQVPGEHFILAQGKMKKVDRKTSYRAKPSGVAFLFKDNTLALRYDDMDGNDVIYVPFNVSTAPTFMAAIGITRDNKEDFDSFVADAQKVMGGDKTAFKAIEEFARKFLGPGTSQQGAVQTPSGGNTKEGINLQDLPVGAKIEMRNGEPYYNGKKVIM